MRAREGYAIAQRLQVPRLFSLNPCCALGTQSRSDCRYPDCLFSQVVACLILCYMVVFHFSRTPCVPPFTALMLVTGLGLVVFWMTWLSVAREVWSALVPSQWV
ncbi:Uncharacterised protein [Mobiluncus mulieris]|nr:Uncharacterised protein [Mobiluncus mulieris]